MNKNVKFVIWILNFASKYVTIYNKKEDFFWRKYEYQIKFQFILLVKKFCPKPQYLQTKIFLMYLNPWADQ